MTRRIAVRGIIFKNGKLFCVQQKHKNGSMNDYWSTPGGGLDPNEGLKDGLRREIIEELGVTPTISNLLFVQQYAEGDAEQIEFFFHVTNADDYETIDLSSTSHGKLEIVDVEFIDPKIETILPAFLSEIDISTQINNTSPPQVFSYL